MTQQADAKPGGWMWLADALVSEKLCPRCDLVVYANGRTISNLSLKVSV